MVSSLLRLSGAALRNGGHIVGDVRPDCTVEGVPDGLPVGIACGVVVPVVFMMPVLLA